MAQLTAERLLVDTPRGIDHGTFLCIWTWYASQREFPDDKQIKVLAGMISTEIDRFNAPPVAEACRGLPPAGLHDWRRSGGGLRDNACPDKLLLIVFLACKRATVDALNGSTYLFTQQSMRTLEFISSVRSSLPPACPPSPVLPPFVPPFRPR